jgi:hypothetical protein
MIENMRWFKEGREACRQFDMRCLVEGFDEDYIPECPWPIYSPEGIAWLRGWNSETEKLVRPGNSGNLFRATDEEMLEFELNEK